MPTTIGHRRRRRLGGRSGCGVGRSIIEVDATNSVACGRGVGGSSGWSGCNRGRFLPRRFAPVVATRRPPPGSRPAIGRQRHGVGNGACTASPGSLRSPSPGSLDVAKGAFGPLAGDAGAAGTVGARRRRRRRRPQLVAVPRAVPAVAALRRRSAACSPRAPAGAAVLLGGLVAGRLSRQTGLGCFVAYVALVPVVRRVHGTAGELRRRRRPRPVARQADRRQPPAAGVGQPHRRVPTVPRPRSGGTQRDRSAIVTDSAASIPERARRASCGDRDRRAARRAVVTARGHDRCSEPW